MIPAPSLSHAGRSSGGSGWSGLLYGRQDLLHGRLEEQPFLGHRPAIHQDREFPRLAVHQLHLDARFLPQSCRQTGGVLADAPSGRAFPDRHLLHRARSFPMLRATSPRRCCMRRAVPPAYTDDGEELPAGRPRRVSEEGGREVGRGWNRLSNRYRARPVDSGSELRRLLARLIGDR
jgi:hypothetical protein